MDKTTIVLHHSATWDDKTIKDFDAIKAGHLAIGDRDIGYHWVIEYANGQLAVFQGRRESDSAAACPGKNFDAIHICLVGNFEESIPTQEEYQAVANKCKDIMTRWPIKEIGGHRDYFATACPGANYNVEYVKELVRRNGVMEGATACTIEVGGQTYPGYILGGHTYFGVGVPVNDFMRSVTRTLEWHSDTLNLEIK